MKDKSVNSFEEIENLFKSKGVERIYVKHLAKKQDNEKNQIFLGSSGSSNNILNTVPARLQYRSKSESKKKRNSAEGTPKIEMILDFHWIYPDGQSFSAPNTRIINYFQYPESRLSGFLQNCEKAPDALRREHQLKYGRRILIFGANQQGTTFGLVVTEKDDPVVSNFPELHVFEPIPILRSHQIGVPIGISLRDRLIDEIKTISGTWHPSITLKPSQTSPVPFKGNQGAGYTLEALLGIPRNASKSPDKYGFEIKSYKASGKISLMTPTADLGDEGRLTFREFMNRYGWLGLKGDGRIVFNGTFFYRIPRPTGKGDTCTLDIENRLNPGELFEEFDESLLVSLTRDSDSKLLSGWSLQKLLDSWSQKHSSACYVDYEKRPYSGASREHDAEYRFSGKAFICEGTNIWRYLESISNKTVYYDPGHEITALGKSKCRPQWRISITKDFKQKLESLYEKVVELG